MASHDDFELERLLDLVLLEDKDNYKNKWPAWSHSHAAAVNGVLAQAALAAHETVPLAFSIHFIQAQFVKASSKELALRYEVRRVFTGGKAATRVVAAKQDSIVRAIVTIGFLKVAAQDEALHTLDHLTEPSPDSRAAAAQTIDADLDDANYGRPGATGRAKNPPSWPIPNMYFPISCQRLYVTPHADISQRIYRIKLQTTCPLSSLQAQILAIILLRSLCWRHAPHRARDRFRHVSHRGQDEDGPSFVRESGGDAESFVVLLPGCRMGCARGRTV